MHRSVSGQKAVPFLTAECQVPELYGEGVVGFITDELEQRICKFSVNQGVCSQNHLKKKRAYISQCFINSSKCWLLIIMVNTSVPMENKDSFFFSFLAIASIYAMIWSVIPLARKNKKAFYAKIKQRSKHTLIPQN